MAKAFQYGTWKFTKGKETYSELWLPAKPLQNALRNYQTHKLPHIQQKKPFLYPSNKFAFPISLALPLTLVYIHHIPTLATGPKKIHFCGLRVKFVAEFY